MARRRRQKLELWLGLLVIVSAVSLTWGYFWLTGQPLGERGYTVHLVLDDAGGLAKGNQVRMAGVEVGVVRSVELQAPDRVGVRLWIGREVELPRDSRAILESASVFGDKMIVLRPGTSSSPLADGDTLSTGTATGLTDLAADLGDRAQSVLLQVEQLLSDTAIADAHASLQALRGSVSEMERLLRKNGDDLAALSGSLRETAETLRGKLDEVEVERTIAEIEATAATMSETADLVRGSAETLSSIAEKIDRGEGTVGLLVNDPGLYDDLRTAAQNIGSLTRDIQMNPGRYLKLSIF